MNIMSKIYLDIDELKLLEPLMEKMEKENFWKKIDHCVAQELNGHEDIYHIYKKI